MKANVTVALLIYKSPKWLEWCLRQLAESAFGNAAAFDVLVVGCDANTRIADWLREHEFADDELKTTHRLLLPERGEGLALHFTYVDYRNADPSEYAMARVYRAWNHAMQVATTEDVVLWNSDMVGAAGWLDELLQARAHLRTGMVEPIVTSLLVESGRLESGLPNYVKDFGRTPETFQRMAFQDHAWTLRCSPGQTFDGGLFMPVLWNRKLFLERGPYPIQKPNHVLAADAELFNRLAEQHGMPHKTAARSVVYHVQLGESWDEP